MSDDERVRAGVSTPSRLPFGPQVYEWVASAKSTLGFPLWMGSQEGRIDCREL
jgi:hypothetical protein